MLRKVSAIARSAGSGDTAVSAGHASRSPAACHAQLRVGFASVRPRYAQVVHHCRQVASGNSRDADSCDRIGDCCSCVLESAVKPHGEVPGRLHRVACHQCEVPGIILILRSAHSRAAPQRRGRWRRRNQPRWCARGASAPAGSRRCPQAPSPHLPQIRHSDQPPCMGP